MKQAIIERTDKWRVVSFGNGWAYGFTYLPTGQRGFLQDDDATQWRDSYDAMQTAYMDENSVWHRRTWNACLAELCNDYLENEQ